MVFSSGIFSILFLPITTILYFLVPAKFIRARNAVLLIASLLFYAWGEPIFVFIMIASIIADWILGMLMEQKKEYAKSLIILALAIHIGLLFVFKYLTFVLSQIGMIINVNTIDIELPIGISFFSFQMMSYVLDVYYKKIPAQRNLGKLALYITMFPQLVAGPIVRYKTIAEEIDNRKISVYDFYKGTRRFVIGLSKKVLLADYLAVAADNIFAVPNIQSGGGIGRLSLDRSNRLCS